MLKKLLKYDFKSVLRFWWIAAISTVALALVGGWGWSIFESEKYLPDMLYAVATLAAFAAVLGGIAFAILTVILLFSRFYKNFFTDEGYLTFTLPVKRSSLLNSKLIVSIVTVGMTTLVILFDVFVAACIGEADTIFTKVFWISIWKDIYEFFDIYNGYAVAIILETILSYVLSIVISVLFASCCITIASIIAKKAKVLTAIAIYYIANSVTVFGLIMYNLFAMETLFGWINDVPEYYSGDLWLLIQLCSVLFKAIICAVLYAFQYWMLDKKLNLS